LNGQRIELGKLAERLRVLGVGRPKRTDMKVGMKKDRVVCGGI
jgi:hypothetical protein